MIDISNLILVYVQQKSNELVLINIEIILTQTHEGHNQRVLLLNLIDQNNLRSSFPKRTEDDGRGDGDEEKNIEENKTNEETIYPKRCAYRNHLIVRIGVVRRHHVHDEYCFIQLFVVIRIWVFSCIFGQHDYLIRNYGETHYHNCIEENVNEKILVCG